MHVFKNEKCAGGKLFKERLTVLVIASMTGEKLPPLVIGKSANQRCFKNITNLPASYEANSQTWMTSSIFKKWLRKLDFQMRNSAKKIAMALNNCTAHPNINGLTNIKLVFLPSNTMAKTQSLDSAVIHCLKAHYAKSLAKLHLLAFEVKKDFTMNVLQAMKLLRQAWNSVSEVTIQNCFKKVNFICLEVEDKGVEAEAQDVEEVESNVNKDAEGIWERLQECGLVSETVTDILRGIQTVAETVQEESDNDDDDSNTVEALLAPVEALTSLRQLDRYLHCHDDSEEMLCLLAKIQNYVVHKSISKPKQLKINNYFFAA